MSSAPRMDMKACMEKLRRMRSKRSSLVVTCSPLTERWRRDSELVGDLSATSLSYSLIGMNLKVDMSKVCVPISTPSTSMSPFVCFVTTIDLSLGLNFFSGTAINPM